MTEKQFNKGDVIFRQGAEGKVFYQIIEGCVGVYVSYEDNADGQLITKMGKGQFFGEMAVIDAYPRSATVICEQDNTRVHEISVDELNEYFSKDPDQIAELMKALSMRIRDLTKEYDEAMAVAEKVGADGQDPDEEFLRRLKRYTYYYKTLPNEEPVPSAETVRESKPHSAGFAMHVVTYPKDTVICKEGDLVDCMYDIHWGRVGIYNRYGTPDQVQLTVLGANEFFGEMGMISDQPRSATAVALDPSTTVEIIYPADFKELFEKNPMKVDMILRHLSSRLRHLTWQYLDISAKISEKTAGAK